MREKIAWLLVVILLGAVVFLLFFKDAEPNADVLRVENRVISEQKFINELKERYGVQLVNEMIEREAINYEAKRLSVEVDEREIDSELRKFESNLAEYDRDFEEVLITEIGVTIDQLKSEIGYNLLLEKLATLDARVSEAEIEKYYNENIEFYSELAKYRISRILVEDRATANQIIGELNAGGDFAALAMEFSTDAQSARAAGDMGYLQADNFYIDPDIISIAAGLSVGDYSKVFETYEGWNIVMLTDRIEAVEYPLVDVKAEIYRELALRQVKPLNEYLQDLLNKLDIEIYEDNIKEILTIKED